METINGRPISDREAYLGVVPDGDITLDLPPLCTCSIHSPILQMVNVFALTIPESHVRAMPPPCATCGGIYRTLVQYCDQCGKQFYNWFKHPYQSNPGQPPWCWNCLSHRTEDRPKHPAWGKCSPESPPLSVSNYVPPTEKEVSDLQSTIDSLLSEDW